ncbi:MAG: GWxTD domain-containing protein [candidate division WOR-3 bacterium]|nr:GWxTD domain-containing protein [candidate division WOR-3 bacterium]
MKKLIFILLIISTIVLNADINVDINRFDAGKGIWEIVCNIAYPSQMLEYTRDEGKLIALLDIDIIIKDIETGNTVTDTWTTSSIISKTEQITKEMSLIDQSAFLLSEGSYEITFIFTDIKSENTHQQVETIKLPAVPQIPFMSDMMIALSIEQDTTGGKFARNSYRVVPNPSHETTALNPYLFIYSEFYNLPPERPFLLYFTVLNNENDTVYSLPAKTGITAGSAFIDVAAVNTLALKSGQYTLMATLESDSFSVSNSVDFTKSDRISKQQLSKYELTDEQIENYGRIEYIAMPSELKKLSQLNDAGRHNFLIRFWEERDPKPNNNRLEALDEFISRIKYADKKFSSGSTEGYETDRGRIYIKYGEPDETMVIPHPRGFKSYENWIYYSQGGMQFIFTDIDGFGDHELVYTNVEEEDIPANWRNYVDTDIIRFSRN